MQFANAVKITSTEIDKKVCTGNHAKGGDVNSPTTFSADLTNSASSKTAQCSGLNAPGTEKFSTFVKGVKLQDGTYWPTGSYSKGGNTPTRNEQNSNAKAVADDLTKNLTHEEKTIVAGLLARTIEGGEVIEIRAVSSTSVMVNACYDLLSEGLGVVPYACVGLGDNFVGVVDGRITPKLAYRLKAGLSYQLSPEISAFVGGFYHCVVGAVSSRRY
ncbi:Major surface antigen 4 precursor [Anaplasma phagocytophilum]|nr:Major surface antigen 4 precursor [Anaplasma phagocytophilum]